MPAVHRPQSAPAERRDDMFLITTRMTSDEHFAVVTVAIREAWRAIIMRRTTRHPRCADSSASESPGDGFSGHHIPPDAINCRMSSTRQAVIRGPSLTGFGYRPLATPAHHVERLTGIGPSGPIIEGRRIKPISGSASRHSCGTLRAPIFSVAKGPSELSFDKPVHHFPCLKMAGQVG